MVAGLREQDALLALGVVPVATSEWFGEHPGAIFPWARDELGDAKVPTVLSTDDGFEVERIAAAAARPDPGGLLGDDEEGVRDALEDRPGRRAAQGQGRLRLLLAGGDADQRQGGRQAGAGAQLVDETEQLIADAAAEHPEFKGQTAANITDYQGIFVYGPQDVRTRMLEQLGFTYPEALRKAFPDDFGGQLSDEKVDALDVGALVWFADGDRTVKELKSDPVYSKLDVRKEGRDVFIRRTTASTRRPRSRRC